MAEYWSQRARNPRALMAPRSDRRRSDPVPIPAPAKPPHDDSLRYGGGSPPDDDYDASPGTSSSSPPTTAGLLALRTVSAPTITPAPGATAGSKRRVPMPPLVMTSFTRDPATGATAVADVDLTQVTSAGGRTHTIVVSAPSVLSRGQPRQHSGGRARLPPPPPCLRCGTNTYVVPWRAPNTWLCTAPEDETEHDPESRVYCGNTWHTGAAPVPRCTKARCQAAPRLMTLERHFGYFGYACHECARFVPLADRAWPATTDRVRKRLGLAAPAPTPATPDGRR